MNFYELIGFHEPAADPFDGIPELPNLDHAAVFLDFDGTLVEIAETPDGIDIAPKLVSILQDLNQRTGGRMAIVSGRSLDAITKFLPDFDGIIVGSHGAENSAGDLAEPPQEASQGLSCVRAIMDAYARHHDGVLLEEKPYSVVLHFRQAPEVQLQIEPLLETLVKEWDNLVLHRAKMALEVMPADVSKKAAVERLHENWSGTIPVAIGDDQTDEGMLRYAVAQGGVGIKVGHGQTGGNLRLETPADVHALLQNWLSKKESLK